MSVTLRNGSKLPLDGDFTLSENIADSGGVATAFQAWKQQQSVDEPGLPGLESFTQNQLFFVKWAQGWCEVSTPELAEFTRVDYNHAPGFARILGPLANSREFRQAFNCPSKEPTCELW